MGAGLTTREHIVLAAMERWSAAAMEWGRDDCMLAVADIVKAISAKDPARRFRGSYRSRQGAERLLGRGGTLRQAKISASACHWRRIDPLHARPGDVGLVRIRVRVPAAKGEQVIETHSAAVCRAKGWFVARAAGGFAGFDAKLVEHCWAID